MAQLSTSTATCDQMSQNGFINLASGYYTCPVDGFLVGIVSSSGGTCIAYGWASCGSAGVWATGGTMNAGNDSNGNPIIASNSNMLFLPIPANNEFAFGEYIYSYGSEPSTVTFWYLPDGDGAPTQVQNPTLQKPAAPQVRQAGTAK